MSVTAIGMNGNEAAESASSSFLTIFLANGSISPFEIKDKVGWWTAEQSLRDLICLSRGFNPDGSGTCNRKWQCRQINPTTGQ